MKKDFIIFNKGKQKELILSAIDLAGTESFLSNKTEISMASLYDYKKELRPISLENLKILVKFMDLNLNTILVGTSKRYLEKWSKKEEDFIIKNYVAMTAREISIKLDKSIDSIKHKRESLGLIKGRAYRWDRKRILKGFNQELKMLKRVPKYAELAIHRPGMVSAIERIWGKYSLFLLEQGLKTSIRTWTKKECLLEFEEIRATIKKIQTQRDLKKCRGLLHAIQRRWKGYNHFLKKLGYSPNFELKWDKRECQREFKKIMRDRDRLITINQLLEINPSLIAAIYKYFGNYPRFLRSLDYETNDEWQGWENLVIKICKKIYSDVNIKPRLMNNKFPDIAIGKKEPFKKIIDAKINSFANSISLGMRKYKPSCKILEFWCLIGSKRLNQKTTKILGVDEIRRLLRDRNELELIKELDDIAKQ